VGQTIRWDSDWTEQMLADVTLRESFWLVNPRSMFTKPWLVKHILDLNSSDWLKSRCVFLEERLLVVLNVSTPLLCLSICFSSLSLLSMMEKLYITFLVILTLSYFPGSQFSYLSPRFLFMISKSTTECFFDWRLYNRVNKHSNANFLSSQICLSILNKPTKSNILIAFFIHIQVHRQARTLFKLKCYNFEISLKNEWLW